MLPELLCPGGPAPFCSVSSPRLTTSPPGDLTDKQSAFPDFFPKSLLCPWITLGSNASMLQDEEPIGYELMAPLMPPSIMPRPSSLQRVLKVQLVFPCSCRRVKCLGLGKRGTAVAAVSFCCPLVIAPCLGVGILASFQRRQIMRKYNIPGHGSCEKVGAALMPWAVSSLHGALECVPLSFAAAV